MMNLSYDLFLMFFLLTLLFDYFIAIIVLMAVVLDLLLGRNLLYMNLCIFC